MRSNYGLTHGVTVALQILVLSVKVRILMGQQRKATHVGWLFLCVNLSHRRPWAKKKSEVFAPFFLKYYRASDCSLVYFGKFYYMVVSSTGNAYIILSCRKRIYV